ncbi:MAG: hypothetical protein NC433_05840 [Clostridiales bacterium]|nr:hypothetical protein [Clostridiales bacterium]
MIKIEVKEGKAQWISGIGVILCGIAYGVIVTVVPTKSAKGEIIYYLLVYLTAAVCILAGAWLCMGAKNRKLLIEDTALCYTNCFGKRRKFALSDIAYCRTALENGGNRNYLKLYDVEYKKLCKLEYNMCDSALFLQYLIDNQVKIECSEKSDYMLKNMLEMETISQEAIADTVNNVYKEAKALIGEWTEKNKSFGVSWKMGLAAYNDNEIEDKKQLWEQKGCAMSENLSGNSTENLPEGYIIAMECYLLKDSEFVINKRGKAICFFAPVISTSKSLKVGEILKISNYRNAVSELSYGLKELANELPRNRYHTETLVLQHELKDGL